MSPTEEGSEVGGLGGPDRDNHPQGTGWANTETWHQGSRSLNHKQTWWTLELSPPPQRQSNQDSLQEDNFGDTRLSGNQEEGRSATHNKGRDRDMDPQWKKYGPHVDLRGR